MDTRSPGAQDQIDEGDIPLALPDPALCRKARLSRDPRFDGRFVIAVVTTGIYCRPSCSVRFPREANVRYFTCAAAAQEAGYRACRRCFPADQLMTPDTAIVSRYLQQALRLIEGGFLNEHALPALANSLDISERHLDRLFMRSLGVSPGAVARLRRAETARKLLRQGELSVMAVAEHAGYQSARQLGRDMRSLFDATPSSLRRRPATGSGAQPLTLNIQLPIMPPYDFDWVFAYLQGRALAGIETVKGHAYARRISRRGEPESWVRVRRNRIRGRDGLLAQLPLTGEPVYQLLSRLMRVFDLYADGAAIHAALQDKSVLASWVNQAPGLRVPGAWDGFETSVRAILGQQVSVARGTELADKMVAKYGEGDFPSPDQLLHRPIAELGMPGARGEAISQLAQRVLSDGVPLAEGPETERFINGLERIPGIGPWTQNYMRLRVAKNPDAFPHNDWVVLKQLNLTPARARDLATAWQPWRAYALMYLWFAAAVNRAQGKWPKGGQG